MRWEELVLAVLTRSSEVAGSLSAGRIWLTAQAEMASRREFLERSCAQGVAREGGRERARRGGARGVEKGGAETSVRSGHCA